jgi:hypothetical protein
MPNPRNHLVVKRRRKLRVGFDPRPTCFKCERPIRGAIATGRLIVRKGRLVRVPLAPGERRHDTWEMPDNAVHFRGGGSYGSRRYDTLMDGITVELIVCDACLKKHCRRLRHTTEESREKAENRNRRANDRVLRFVGMD